MTLNERRAHWKIGAVEGEQNEVMVREVDPDTRRYACFTMSEDAAEWLVEQLAKRTVADLGGFESAANWHDWVLRQGERDEAADPEMHHASGDCFRISAEIGGDEYRMEVCTCTDEVTGRCDNQGCDRDTEYDSEPDGGIYPGYTKWGSHCFRCWYPEYANGGFTAHRKPVPAHQHEGAVRVSRLIEDDEWTGWRCAGDDHHEDTAACGKVWRFADSGKWASRYRLTRMWDGKVTGIQGYTITEAEANAEAERMNQMSADRLWGWTVGVEKIEKEQQS